MSAGTFFGALLVGLACAISFVAGMRESIVGALLGGVAASIGAYLLVAG